MKAPAMIGYTLLNTTSITAITSTRINHGLRPIGTIVPSINYYELGGGTRQNGMISQSFTINCRASTATVARNLAELVIDTFHGSSGTGVYGWQNSSFEISRASMQNDGGLIPEPEDNIYNAPIDIRVVYPVSTVS